MSSKTPEKIKPKFIPERIEELRRTGVSSDLTSVRHAVQSSRVPSTTPPIQRTIFALTASSISIGGA